MTTLLLDTHTNKIIVVLYKNDKIIVQKDISSEYNHSINTMPILIAALKEANCLIKDINAIICVNGPGSFTGVRIGVTISKMLAYTLNIPIKTISSLQLKAVSFKHDIIYIGEQEKNGMYMGKFDRENNLIDEYKYYGKDELDNLTIEYKEDIKIDYIQVLNFVNTLENVNPHLVNPLYIKKIEALK